jgi:hypothetical protein
MNDPSESGDPPGRGEPQAGSRPFMTLETNVWENDWRLILNTGRLEAVVERCHYQFDSRKLLINNVADLSLVEKAAQRLLAAGIITEYIIVDEYAERTLEHFGLPKKDEWAGGLYYSIAQFVGIYLCNTKYLLHFMSDTLPDSDLGPGWVDKLASALENRPNVKVANLTWNHEYAGARNESSSQDDDFFYGYGFSDQMYMIAAADFQKPIYNEKHPASARYPNYGGELFEKRVDSWMRNHEYLRATYRRGSYLSRNFPRQPWKRRLMERFKLGF